MKTIRCNNCSRGGDVVAKKLIADKVVLYSDRKPMELFVKQNDGTYKCNYCK